MASTRLSYIAVAPEDERNEFKYPNTFLDFKEWDGFNLEKEIIDNNPVRWVRENSITAEDWQANISGDLTVDLDINQAGYWLWSVFGDYSVESEGEKYVHIFETGNKVNSLSVEMMKGNPNDEDSTVVRVAGVLVDTMDITADTELVQMQLDLMGTTYFEMTVATGWDTVDGSIETGENKEIKLEDRTDLLKENDTIIIKERDGDRKEEVKITDIKDSHTIEVDEITESFELDKVPQIFLKPRTPNYDWTPKPFSFFHANIYSGKDESEVDTKENEDKQDNVENYTFTYENQLEERYWSLQQTPTSIQEQGVNVTMDFERVFGDKTEIERYQRLTEKYQRTKFQRPWNEDYIQIETPKITTTEYSLPSWTDDIYVESITARIQYDMDKWYAIKVTMKNDVEDYSS